MSFDRDYNELLDEILIAYRNLAPVEQLDVERLKAELPEVYATYLIQGQPDLSEGSLLFISSSALASMLWGLYKSQSKVIDQFFSQTAMRKYLERQCGEFGITTAEKTDEQLRSELQAEKRNKRAGGNRYDYEAWAKEISTELSLCNPLNSQISNSGMGNFSAVYAVDVDTLQKAWDTDEAVPGAYIEIDLGSNVKRAYTKLILCMNESNSTAIYDIKCSNNGAAWTTAYSGFAPDKIANNEIVWTSVGEFRYWRLELTRTPGSGPYVVEMSWYEGPEFISYSKTYPLAQGEGTFDVVVVGNLSRGIPSAQILTLLNEYMQNKRLVGAGFTWGLRVCKPTVLFQDIVMSGTGASFDKVKTKAAIESYLDSLLPGDILYRDQLRAIAVSNGALSVSFTTPTDDVEPVVTPFDGTYGLIRHGVVTIS